MSDRTAIMLQIMAAHFVTTRAPSACHRLLWLLTALSLLGAGCSRCSSSQEIRVLTDRTEDHLAPIFAAYTEATGIPINAVYIHEGFISRLESRPTEADVVITKDADLMAIAASKGLLQPLGSERIARVLPEEYRSPDGLYFSDSYRSRVIFYSRDRVRPSELSSYDDLADPRRRGRVCIRSGYHDYNLNFFAQMMEKRGVDQTRDFIENLAANLARRPMGSDRDQVKAIYEGGCDLSLGNSYYMGIMLSSSLQRPWGESAGVFFPDQGDCGSFVILSGLALTKARRNVPAARKLLEYMVQGSTQDFTTKLTYAYPVIPGRPMPELNRSLGAGQPEVIDGRFKICSVPLERIAANREKVIQLLDEIQFDQKP
jgi:iron(III) transport system substrate-binding protein